MSEHHGPAEQAIEALVFAPIGFALEARRLFPTFVERGRQQVQMTRIIGKFAFDQGQVVAGRQAGRWQRQAETLLADLGLAAPAGAKANRSTPATSAPEEAAAPVTKAEPAVPQVDVDELAIAAYDSLAASHVIPRLAGLASDELELVRRYESTHRSRKTILGRIAQLQGN